MSIKSVMERTVGVPANVVMMNLAVPTRLTLSEADYIMKVAQVFYR